MSDESLLFKEYYILYLTEKDKKTIPPNETSIKMRSTTFATKEIIKKKYSKLFDVDCNLTSAVFHSTPTSMHNLLVNAYNNGVRFAVSPGMNVKESAKAVELARKYSNSLLLDQIIKNNKESSLSNANGSASIADNFKIFSTIGIHPYEAVLEQQSIEDAMNELRKLYYENKNHIYAVGECGLDTSEGFPNLEKQIPVFEAQIDLSYELKLPLFLHERLAHEPFVMCLLKAFERNKSNPFKPNLLVHCFTGTTEELQVYINPPFNAYISLAGIVLNKGDDPNQLEIAKKVAALVPIDKLMIETDAPYLGWAGCNPEIKRKRFPNVPSALPQIADAIVEIRYENEKRNDISIDKFKEEFEEITCRNAIEFFNNNKLD